MSHVWVKVGQPEGETHAFRCGVEVRISARSQPNLCICALRNSCTTLAEYSTVAGGAWLHCFPSDKRWQIRACCDTS